MNYKTMMFKQAMAQGRETLHPFAIGVITTIVKNDNVNGQLNDIALALESMNEAWNDESLPWNYEDVDKASAETEAVEEISHLDCTIDAAGTYIIKPKEANELRVSDAHRQ